MNSHFNGLTPAEAERLACLMEEMAEAQQVIGKILRHGWESTNPTIPFEEQRTNRELLTKELGDVMAALDLMYVSNDLSPPVVYSFAERKSQSMGKWLHHQEAP